MQDGLAGLKIRHRRGRLLESRKSKDPDAGEANILLCSASAYLAVECWPRSKSSLLYYIKSRPASLYIYIYE